MKKKWWILGGLLIAVGSSAGFYYGRSPGSELTYQDFKVKRGDITRTILATGTVQPENRLEIKPPIAGRVEKVLVKEGQILHRGQVLALMSSTERAALVDAARAKGAEELKRWEDLYRETPIIAPIAGTLISRNVEPGQSFNANDVLLVMSDRLTVKAQVDETDIAQIKLKQGAQIVLDAYADQKIPATVDEIAFEAKTVNNVTTYIVAVLPKETPDSMRSGMTANVTFDVESKDGVLLVPREAVKTTDGKSSVMVRGPSGAPVEHEVTIGVNDNRHVEITDGLAEGDTVLAARVNKKNRSRADGGTNPFAPNIRPSGGGRSR